LYDRNLTYRGFRVLPYCWNDETPLSNHELRMDDDVYKMRQDPSITVQFTITGLPENPELIPQNGATPEIAASLTGVGVLAWTTTRWGVPSNLWLTAAAEIEYAVVAVESAEANTYGAQRGLLATDRVVDYANLLG